jgi:hypothetical protein
MNKENNKPTLDLPDLAQYADGDQFTSDGLFLAGKPVVFSLEDGQAEVEDEC